MSKVITFSRTFPSYHPRKGEPTYFVEKMLNSYWKEINYATVHEMLIDLNRDKWNDEEMIHYSNSLDRSVATDKGHTIRAGHRWKEGDWFSPRVWSGKPYNSKQIIIAPDIQIKKVWDFQIVLVEDGILRSYEMQINGKLTQNGMSVYQNDGLKYNDFCDWFKMDKANKKIHFDGQIICWNENIEY